MATSPENRGSIREAAGNGDQESQKKMGDDLRQEVDVVVCDDMDAAEDVHHHLHRGLKSRQVAMIAIGGAIGYANILFHSRRP
jgi:amino acid transporter